MTALEEPPPWPIDLAREADFRLGPLEVSPSACRVRGPGGEQRVEPRVMEVLVVLVRNAGRTVSRDQLIAACWGGRIVSDDAVTRAVAQVRALGRGLEPPPFTLDTVPKVGFRLSVSDAPDRPAASPAPRRRGTRRITPWAIAAAACVALAAAGALGWRWLASPAPSPWNGHVEVMQFAAQSPDPVVQQIARDLPQDLVRILSAGGVQTAQEPLARDAGESDAGLRIAGSVDLDGGKYVTTTQILDRRTGIVLWANRIARSPDEQARSPGLVAASVAAMLDCMLNDGRLAGAPRSTEVASLYLNACAGVFFADDNGERMLMVSRKLAQAAPKFAGAHAMHAIAAALVANATEAAGEATALHEEAKAAAERALKLDRHAAKAYCALAVNEGVWGARLRHDWFAEERYLLQGLKYDPDLAPALNEYGMLLRSTGRIAEALQILKLSSAAGNPSYGSDPRTAMLMAATGDVEGAEALLTAMEAHDRVSQDSMRWTIAFWWDPPKVGLQKIRALAHEQPPQLQACFEAYLEGLIARQGRPGRGLPASCDSLDDANWRVRMLARQGDIDGAYATLKDPIPGGPVVLYYPEMRGFRADPRFWPLVRRIGLAGYWVRSGHWPDFCAEPGLPYDCRKMARATSGT